MRRGLAAALALAASAAQAEPLDLLGWSHVITNDSIGEFRDRWQSSVVSGSVFLGDGDADPTRAALGRILELRATSQIITPESLSFPASDDRPFAGILALDLLTHGRLGATEVSLGAGLSATGPDTGTFDFQRWLHTRLGYPLPATTGNEIDAGLRAGLSAEIGRSFGETLRLRPFAELRAGPETLARAGLDLTWGGLGADDLMTRETVTGQRVPGLMGADVSGWSVMAGGDAAWVADSLYLPEDRGLVPENRLRLRAGAHWQTERLSAFYGITWLSPEFEGQAEGQFVGAVQLRLNF